MQGGTGQLVMLVMIVIVFYFFMIRPQMKKQKELKKFNNAHHRFLPIDVKFLMQNFIKICMDWDTMFVELIVLRNFLMSTQAFLN